MLEGDGKGAKVIEMGGKVRVGGDGKVREMGEDRGDWGVKGYGVW